MSLSYPDLPLTSAPDNVQEIDNIMDVDISTLPLVKQFNQYLDNNDLASAQALIQNNPNLDASMLNAKKYNMLSQTMVAMQRHYRDNTTGYVNQLKQETTNYVDDKKQEILDYTDTEMQETASYVNSKKTEFQVEVDKLTYRGEWQPSVQYHKKNVVTSGGEGFIAKLDSVNQPPPSSTYWGKIAGKGAKGDPSLNINYKGAYDSSVVYTLGDAITYGGLWYYAIKNTLGNPPTNADYWELQTNQTLIGDTQPFDNRITGWVDTTL